MKDAGVEDKSGQIPQSYYLIKHLNVLRVSLISDLVEDGLHFNR